MRWTSFVDSVLTRIFSKHSNFLLYDVLEPGSVFGFVVEAVAVTQDPIPYARTECEKSRCGMQEDSS